MLKKIFIISIIINCTTMPMEPSAPSVTRTKQQLLQAIQTDSFAGIRQAIVNGADINHGYGKKWTPLHLAASGGNPEVVEERITLFTA